jgi:hypothetical protein
VEWKKYPWGNLSFKDIISSYSIYLFYFSLD